MWIDVGKLIREHTPDKNGNVLPQDLAFGSYDIRDLTNKGVGTLFEGKIMYDTTYGHVTYGCGVCCGYRTVLFWWDPLDISFLGTSDNGVNAFDTCSNAEDDVSELFYGHWTTANSSIATADFYGTHTGQGVGSTTTSTWGTLQQWKPHSFNCPDTVFHPGGGDNVSLGFTVGYNAYIDVDHITGPSGCTWSGGLSTNYIYMGDGNRGTYRAAEQIQVVPDAQQGSGFFQDTGQTRNYGVGSPANGSTLSSRDEDGIPNDCYVWNNAGKAVPNFSYDVSFPNAHQGQVHYTGSVSNPLESQLATIQWDMRTVIDATNPQAPKAYVNYTHTCYPAHQIKVNGAIVYSYFPVREDPNYIFNCLSLHTGTVTGQTQPTPVPTH